MSGFPTRLLRSFLGPKLEDIKPVDNPKTQIGASTWEAVFRQVCGMNLGAPRAVLVANWTGSDFQITHQSEAWSPENDQPHPALARASAGVYSYTFAQTYKDGNGHDVSVSLPAARATPLNPVNSASDTISAAAFIDPQHPLVVEIRLFDASGDPADAPFWLEVL